MRVPLPLTILAAIALAACSSGPPAATGTPGGAATTPPAAATTPPAAATTPPAAATTPPTVATATPGGAVGSADDVSCNDGGEGTAVTIVDNAFQPAAVTADADDSVNWTNTGDSDHTVTFDNGKDCGELESGQTLTVEFLAPGTYPYHCDIHGTMKGTVTVDG